MTIAFLEPPVHSIDHFLEFIDVPYTDDLALERACDLMRFYRSLESDPTKARMVARFALSSFWNFLALLAWTEDEKASFLSLKPMAPLAYVYNIAEFVDAREANGIDFVNGTCIFPKSRQLMVSWLATLWSLYLCLRRRSTKALYISKTEDHGKELLLRCNKAYNLLPRWFKVAIRETRPIDRMFNTDRGVFLNGSTIIVLPERGGDSARSFSATCVILDEAGSQPSFSESWTAVQGGAQSARGRTSTWAISTAKVTSFGFKEIHQDIKDGITGGVDIRFHDSRGLHIYRNKLNKANIVEVHYTADPAKATVAWRIAAQADFRSMADWKQEMEMDYFALSGTPLFPMLDPTIHMMRSMPLITKDKGKWFIEVPKRGGEKYVSRCVMGLGIDHGRRNPCGAVMPVADRSNDVFIGWDYSEVGRTASENAWAIKKALGDKYDGCAFQAIDAMSSVPDRHVGKIEDLYRYEYRQQPDGEYLKCEPILPRLMACKKFPGSVQAGIDQIADMLHATRAVVAPDDSYWELNRYDKAAVKKFAQGRMLLIAPSCHETMKELQLGRYKDTKDDTVNQPEGEKDMHNHIRKAFSYLMGEGFGYRE